MYICPMNIFVAAPLVERQTAVQDNADDDTLAGAMQIKHIMMYKYKYLITDAKTNTNTHKNRSKYKGGAGGGQCG